MPHDTFVEVGENRNFSRLDTIPAGVPFPKYIMEQLRRCLVVLVFIGRDWLSVRDEEGRRRA